MPQLPNRNTLDYSPDSIISASKRISIVQSSQMKDANETSATLRPVKDSNETKAEVAKFVEIISTIADTFNDLRRLAIDRGNQGINELVNEELDREEGAGRQLVNRLYGGMPTKTKASASKGSATITDFFQKVSSNNDPRRPSVPEFHERAESRGQARSSAREDDFDELYDAEGGDDDPNPEDDDDDDEDDESDDDTGLSEISRDESELSGDNQFIQPDNELRFSVKDQIVARLIRATKLIREASLSLSRLKSASRYLTDSDIEELKMSYNILIKKWESLQYPFSGTEDGRRFEGGYDFFDLISQLVEFSANILKVLNDERKKLMMDILILVNSYNANESLRPNFDPATLVQPVKNVLDDFGTENIVTATVVGSGRNFFGKQINDALDIPNIYGRHQACPTKYLL